MRQPWSSRLAASGRFAAAQAYVATTGNAADASVPLAGFAPEPLASPWPRLAERGMQAWGQLAHWIAARLHARAGAHAWVVDPACGSATCAHRHARRAGPAHEQQDRDASTRAKRRPTARSCDTEKTEISPWPTEAWVEAEGFPGSRHIIGRTLIRIGREEDNDLRFAVKTVHRYHAVIRRTTDGVVMITDLSGKDGNGVLVNGARRSGSAVDEGRHHQYRRGQDAV